ncbi:MAG: nicotinate-nicotinamide nucleotide adenylyltransferase [Rikenellaceae bacterium]
MSNAQKIVGLLFGSFDPIHRGHISIARWALQAQLCDEVWMVLSPQNPMKPNSAAPYDHRASMVRLVVEDVEGVQLCRDETELTPPYYTINTVQYLMMRYPQCRFMILCGTDVKEQSHTWYRAEELHTLVDFVEYPRFDGGELPFIDVSSTEIRCGEKLEYLDERVREYIEKNKVYCAHFERGQIRYRLGDITGAINEWNQCTDEPHLTKANALKELAGGIMEYRYDEIYNP